eukprot:XP_011435639.1 PREDICTED: uncharacterized protein LOC105334043 isoform X1 [Crassostrea gigas]
MNTARMTMFYSITILVGIAGILPYCYSQKCCTVDEWTADMFLDYGLVAIDSNQGSPKTAYSYINGTVKATYDYTNRRCYLKLQGAEVSPLLPVPSMPFDTTIINDYKKGIQYNIGPDGSCMKSTINNMTKQCIPDNAELTSEGSLVMDWNIVKNFRYTITDDITTDVDATISQITSPPSCNPVHMVYFVGSMESGSGSLINLDVMNVVPYSIDPSVFNVPPQCKNATTMVKRNSMLDRLFMLNIFI